MIVIVVFMVNTFILHSLMIANTCACMSVEMYWKSYRINSLAMLVPIAIYTDLYSVRAIRLPQLTPHILAM